MDDKNSQLTMRCPIHAISHFRDFLPTPTVAPRFCPTPLQNFDLFKAGSKNVSPQAGTQIG